MGPWDYSAPAVYFVRMLISWLSIAQNSECYQTADHEFFDDHAHRPHWADEKLCFVPGYPSPGYLRQDKGLDHGTEAVGRSVNVDNAKLARKRTWFVDCKGLPCPLCWGILKPHGVDIAFACVCATLHQRGPH